MEDYNFSELFELVSQLEDEIFKYIDGKSTENQVVKILGKINALFFHPPKKDRKAINLTKVRDLMDILSKLIIISYEVLKH